MALTHSKIDLAERKKTFSYQLHLLKNECCSHCNINVKMKQHWLID